MPKPSAGLLLYRRTPGGIEFLIVHPGGPLWARKDAGAWSIPKGEYAPAEDPASAARREFEEETGALAPAGPLLALGVVVQAGGKRVTAFAAEGDFDPAVLASNTVEIAWPPRSGRWITVPEVDRAAWVSPAVAKEKLMPAQRLFVDRLLERLELP